MRIREIPFPAIETKDDPIIIPDVSDDLFIGEKEDILDLDEDEDFHPPDKPIIPATPPPTASYGEELVPHDFGESPFTASYEAPPTSSLTENYVSFARIKLYDLTTATGDIYKIKTYMRSRGAFSGYHQVADTILESNQLLIDSSSVSINKRTGYFADQNVINKYWTATGGVTMTHASNVFLNAMRVTGSDGTDTISHNNNVDFRRGADYKIRAKYYGEPTGSKEAKISVYISGSAFPSIDSNGLPLGDLTIDSSVQFADATGSRLGYRRFHVTPEKNGTGTVVYKLVSGTWNIAHVSVIAFEETGFSPDTCEVVVPIPTTMINDLIDFKFELYDPLGNMAPFSIYSNGNRFVGGNTYIAGTDNLITGSVYLGSTIGSGIEQAGTTSAYIRSVGYTGFTSASAPIGADNKGQTGFIMWSGSVLPNSGDNYAGVGIELHGSESYLRFRTNPSELDIRTDRFFLGSTNQYVSGADGNIEISSSNFHLTAEGNVTMSGIITAQGGIIGGFVIGSSSLHSVNNQIFISGSPAVGGVDNSAYMFISSSNFNVKQSGDITGSQVLFDGGKVGGFGINATQLSGNNIVIDSAGIIQTSDFVSSDFGAGKGWKIDQDGLAEFENAIIRGSLSTTVFERDTVSAVGGQLIVSNATTISGSEVLAPDTSFVVKNVGGFVPLEYLIAKATSSTGFATEYMRVTAIDSSTNTFTVTRGENATTLPTMSDGQVVVSAGAFGGISPNFSGSGYIHLNADPTNANTPYIDIIERTGSDDIDEEVKVRLGDLSGISDPIFGSISGYGLYTENAYLKGHISASSAFFSGNIISEATMSGGYIIGSTIKTAETSNRVELHANRSTFEVYNSAGNIVAYTSESDASFDGHVSLAAGFGGISERGVGIGIPFDEITVSPKLGIRSIASAPIKTYTIISASAVISMEAPHNTGDYLGLLAGIPSDSNQVGIRMYYDYVNGSADNRLSIVIGGADRAIFSILGSGTALGINNLNPLHALSVTGNISGSGDLDIDGNITGSGATFSRNVGIGTDIPAERLDLFDGILNFDGVSVVEGSQGSIIQGATGGSSDEWLFRSRFDNIIIQAGLSDGNRRTINLRAGSVATKGIFISNAGLVGMGTVTPPELLTVEGNISGSGDLKIDGEIKGQRSIFTFGDVTSRSADVYLQTTTGVLTSATQGYYMHRAGSIVGISANFDVTTNSGGGGDALFFDARIDGSTVFRAQWLASGEGTGVKNASNTQARGTDTFSAGDILSAFVDETGTHVWEDVIMYIEVVFDD